MAKAARRPAVQLVDESLLDDNLKAQLRARARAAAQAEREKAAEDALYAKYLEEERRAGDPQHEIKYIVLDLAGHSDRITMDGVVYFHGLRYGVPKPVYDSMREIVARGWKHEAEVGGANRNNYQRPRDTVVRHLGGGVGAVTHRGLVNG